MRKLCFFLLLFIACSSGAQNNDSLNTAKDCLYMTPEEREMIREINLVRCNPPAYLQYIQPMLSTAQETLKKYGKGSKNYSLTFTTSTANGKSRQKIDTTWHFVNEEEVKALQTLVNDLKKLKRMPALLPDSGIYKAAKKHAADQHAHDWKLMHTGSDGSDPWDRITKFSPGMSFGNENIAAQSGFPSVRDIVIQLLVDSGIPGYGHRYNLLDPQWTHAGCTAENYKGSMYWWIQDFGVKKKN